MNLLIQPTMSRCFPPRLIRIASRLVLATITLFHILPPAPRKRIAKRQDRLEREDQRHRNNEAELERWRDSIQFASIAYSKSTGQWGLFVPEKDHE